MHAAINLFFVSLVIFTCCLFSLPTLAQTECATLDKANFLFDQWQTAQSGKRTTEHWWVIDEMNAQGVGRWINSEEKISYQEELRLIVMQDQLYYLAKVAQNPLPIAFKAIKCESNRIVFENLQHDFPQRIEYLNTDNKLLVTVSGEQQKSFTLHLFKRQ